jgi:hypothetical protein
MAHMFIASDLRADPFIRTDLPKLLGTAGHEQSTIHPMEKIVEATEHSAIAHGGTDLAVLVHSTPTARGSDSPVRVLKKLRGLSNILLFRNAVKAESIPALVIAKNADLAAGDANALNGMDWVEVVDPTATSGQVITAIRDIVFDWRTDLLRELECVGYAVVVGPAGQLDVKPTFTKKQVEGEIIKGTVSLTALQKAKYVVLSSDVFRDGASYRQLAYLIQHFRDIAAEQGTKPEEVFQRFFTANPDTLFTQGFAKLFPKPRLMIPEDPGKWLEPDYVVKPKVSAQLGTRWEILDLKLPDVEIVRGSKFHQTFTANVFKACQQLADYHRYFARDDDDAKKELLKNFAFHPRNPKLAVLIGRSSTALADAFDHASRTFPVPSVEIITYDEILEKQSLRIADHWNWITRIT